MIDAENGNRVRRLKYWIAGLTLLPGALLVAAGFTKAAFGYFIGGALIFLNLLGTERSILAFLRGRGIGRFLILILYLAKLALTAAVIAVVLIKELISPLALLFGITTFIMALMFDFLFFNRNIRGGEEL